MAYQVQIILLMLLLPTQSPKSMQFSSELGTCIQLICKLMNFDLILNFEGTLLYKKIEGPPNRIGRKMYDLINLLGTLSYCSIREMKLRASHEMSPKRL